MTKNIAWSAVLGILVCGLTAGCNWRPKPPKAEDGKVLTSLAVHPENAAELTAVTAAEEARVNYHYRLVVLKGYYVKTGDMDKRKWTDEELENLADTHTFTWEGLPEISPPQGESLAGADEHMLVEYTVSARNAYLKAMRALFAYYQESAPSSYKAQRVANTLDRFDPVQTYMYFFEAELPPADQKPDQVIPEADKLFAEGLRLYEEGKGMLKTFVTTDYNKERRALMTLLQMVHQYPRSTKIAEAAFYIGEIYKEYFNENIRAVAWYERAWQWDPNITLPARFQAALIYDIRLINRAKAIELYRQVILHEQYIPANVQTAHRRIRELTGS